jgi:hypothetical protein
VSWVGQPRANVSVGGQDSRWIYASRSLGSLPPWYDPPEDMLEAVEHGSGSDRAEPGPVIHLFLFSVCRFGYRSGRRHASFGAECSFWDRQTPAYRKAEFNREMRADEYRVRGGRGKTKGGWRRGKEICFKKVTKGAAAACMPRQ